MKQEDTQVALKQVGVYSHLENGQKLYFNGNNINKRINNPPKTTLLVFGAVPS